METEPERVEIRMSSIRKNMDHEETCELGGIRHWTQRKTSVGNATFKIDPFDRLPDSSAPWIDVSLPVNRKQIGEEMIFSHIQLRKWMIVNSLLVWGLR